MSSRNLCLSLLPYIGLTYHSLYSGLTHTHTHLVAVCQLAVSQGHSRKAVTVDDSSKIKGCGSCDYGWKSGRSINITWRDAPSTSVHHMITQPHHKP